MTLTVGSLQGGNTTGGNISLGSNNLTVGTNNLSDVAYSWQHQRQRQPDLVGIGSLTLSGTSTYSGNTTIKSGTLLAGASVSNATAGPFGNSTNAILLGDTTGSNSAALLLPTGGFTFGRNIVIQAGSSGTAHPRLDR